MSNCGVYLSSVYKKLQVSGNEQKIGLSVVCQVISSDKCDNGLNGQCENGLKIHFVSTTFLLFLSFI